MVFSERLDINSVLLFMSVGQMIASVVFLTFKKKPKQDKSTWFLVFVLIILSFNILEPVLIWTRLLLSVPHLLYIGPSFLLLLGPFIFWQVLALRRSNFKWKPAYLLHTVPFLLLTIQKIPVYLQSAAKKIEVLNQFYALEGSEDYLVATGDLLSLSIQLHPIVYVVAAMEVLNRGLKQKVSRLNIYHRFYLVSLFVTLVVYLFGGSVISLLGIYSSDLYWSMVSLLIFGFVCIVSYLILTARLAPAVKKRELKSDGEADAMYAKLTAFMKEERPYLSSDVSLNSMAQMLDVAPHYLSRVIKEFENKNFLEFINHYRIEAVKSLITNPEMKHFTIEAIGQEAGFANKMSLSRTFKKHCGMTPSEYRNKALQHGNE